MPASSRSPSGLWIGSGRSRPAGPRPAASPGSSGRSRSPVVEHGRAWPAGSSCSAARSRLQRDDPVGGDRRRASTRSTARTRASARSTPRASSARAPSPPPPRPPGSPAPPTFAEPVKATVRFSNASGNPKTSDANPIAGPRHGGQVPPARRRGHRPGDGAAGGLHGPHPRGLPRLHAGPHPRPRDRPARPGQGDGLHRRAPRDRQRPPARPAEARPDHQLRHLRLQQPARLRPRRRRRRRALGPLPVAPDSRASSTSATTSARRPAATTSRRRSASAWGPGERPSSGSTSCWPPTATRSPTRPRSGRATARSSPSATLSVTDVIEEPERLPARLRPDQPHRRHRAPDDKILAARSPAYSVSIDRRMA